MTHRQMHSFARAARAEEGAPDGTVHEELEQARAAKHEKVTDKANVRALPPLILLGALATGIFVRFALPAPVLPTAVAASAGAAVISISVAIVALAARELRKARTAFDVRRPTTSVVRCGPFRFSRNPVYFSMLLLHLGVGLLVNSPWMLALVFPFGSVLCRAVIRPEERYLEQKFGDVYRTYQASVRRWI